MSLPIIGIISQLLTNETDWCTVERSDNNGQVMDTAKEELLHWIPQLAGHKVLVVGDLFLDEYVLGQATRWAVANSEVLQHTLMVGGDPRQGEVHHSYGRLEPGRAFLQRGFIGHHHHRVEHGFEQAADTLSKPVMAIRQHHAPDVFRVHGRLAIR